MKVYRLRYTHYLQVVFPLLADKYHWMYLSELSISKLLFRFLGINHTTDLSRSKISPRNLRRLVELCEFLTTVPHLFNRIFQEMISIPFATVKTLCRRLG